MKRHRTRNYIIYLIVTTVIILLAFNVVMTVIIHKKLEKLTETPGRWPAGSYIHNDIIGFDFAPLISDYISDGSFYVKSHSLGYRISKDDDPYNYGKGGVLSLGCSFTYGDEVDNEYTFTQYIADSLDISAYNYGVSSFSYAHALLKARYLKKSGILDSLEPGIVVLGCWKGLVKRTRTPYPPLSSKALKLEAAYFTKSADSVIIKYPIGSSLIFDLAHLYRSSERGLTIHKFFKIFISVPEIISIYYKDLNNTKRSWDFYRENKVSEFEIYDYYFTGIEKVFSGNNTKIVVLFMPAVEDEDPTDDMMKALEKHTDIIFVNGTTAIKDFNVPVSEYLKKHPHPMAHEAYANKIIEKLNND